MAFLYNAIANIFSNSDTKSSNEDQVVTSREPDDKKSTIVDAQGPDINWPKAAPDFGTPIREMEFNLDPLGTFLNHGAYGTIARTVSAEFKRLNDEFDNNPDLFLRETKSVYWESNVAALANFVGSNVSNLTFTENTTRGLNNCLKSIRLVAGDAILRNNWSHRAAVELIDQVLELNPGVSIVIINHTVPINNKEEIVQQYEDTLAANPNIKVAIIDHISSLPAVLFPLKELIQTCHQHDVIVLVDAAHAPGHVPLNLEDLEADFYVGNLTKWLFVPRGFALLWVHPIHHMTIRPAVTSFDYNAQFPTNFFAQGVRDDLTYFCTQEALNFLKYLGGMETTAAYNEPLLSAAMTMLAQAWGTELYPIPVDMQVPNMRNIRLPELPSYGKNSEEAARLQRDLWHNYKIWCNPFYHRSDLHCRISVNVYCTMTDFELLRDAILDLQAELPTSERQEKSRSNPVVLSE